MPFTLRTLSVRLFIASVLAVAAATVRRIKHRPRSLLPTMSVIPPLPSGALDAAVDRRNTGSRKISGRKGEYVGRDVVPMWVADMDFRSPQPIVDALVARAADGVYGYTDCSPELAELLCERLRRVYGCTGVSPSPEWFRWLPGLLPGLNHAVRTTCVPNTADAVAIPTPVYAPFLASPINCAAVLTTVPFTCTRRPGGAAGKELYFEVDWEGLEAAISSQDTKLLHWCNPHNPAGRCWTRQELVRVARLCVTHDVLLCSDEVWGELPLDPTAHPFTSMLALITAADTSTVATAGAAADPAGVAPDGVPGLYERLVVLTSPSKCFNVAPLDIATAIIPHEPLRTTFIACGRDAAEVSVFGYVAAQAAYGEPECEAWRMRLVDYLRANRDVAAARLTAMGISCVVPEASYLMWMDATDVLPPGTNAEAWFKDVARVGLTPGVEFGGGLGTVRLNYGCRRETLDEALRRMEEALAGVKKE